MAFELQPPKSTALIDIQQAWYRLRDLLNKQYVDTGWGNVLFVDAVDGNDTTAKRGSITFAYATIQAALDAAQEGDVVWVGPGTYTEDVVWPDTDNVTLRGMGIEQTVIQNDTATATITVAPTVDTVETFSVFDMRVNNDGAAACLAIDGTNDANLGAVDNPIWLQNLRLEAAALGLTVNFAAHIRADKIYSYRASTTAEQYGLISFTNAYLNDITVQNNGTGDAPTAGLGAFVIDTTIAGNVTVIEEATFVATDDTQINDLTVNVADDGGIFGNAMVAGRILGDIDADFEFDDTVANKVFLILDGARISGTLNVAATETGDGGYCRAINAVFYDTSDDAITADSEAIIDIRGSQFAQAALNSDDTLGTTPGTIDRTHWYETIASGSDLAAGVAITFGIPYPAAAAGNYTVVTEAADQLDDAGGMGISSKLATGVTVTGTNGGGGSSAGDVRVHVIREFD